MKPSSAPPLANSGSAAGNGVASGSPLPEVGMVGILSNAMMLLRLCLPSQLLCPWGQPSVNWNDVRSALNSNISSLLPKWIAKILAPVPVTETVWPVSEPTLMLETLSIVPVTPRPVKKGRNICGALRPNIVVRVVRVPRIARTKIGRVGDDERAVVSGNRGIKDCSMRTTCAA